MKLVVIHLKTNNCLQIVIPGKMDGWMDGQIDGTMDGCTD
jgi:hypothetical protein